MAAVFTEIPPARTIRRTEPPLRIYRPGPAAPAHAAAAAVSGPLAGTPRRHAAAVYRRRRLLAGGLLLLAIAAVLVLAQLIQAGIGGGPLTTTGAAAGSGLVPAGAREYVVRPGDTLWSIAAALSPGRDERPLVDRLAGQVGGTDLYPGEVIPIPVGR
ncbi:MAG TPA: LysM domain-containing protein [Acidimicrobiales bacterium]|nr:LysM domain-containing protein [Acidimicrobiales bacterium]